jgi:predicted kinase
MEAVIFIGIQGSGKSTFYKENFFDTHIRINLDMLKTRHREHLLLKACIEAKQKLVVDNTNVTREQREKYISAARAARFRIIGYYFQTSLEDALLRNSRRIGEKCIPEKGVLATYKRLEVPFIDEGFDVLYHVELNESNNFIISTEDKR